MIQAHGKGKEEIFIWDFGDDYRDPSYFAPEFIGMHYHDRVMVIE